MSDIFFSSAGVRPYTYKTSTLSTTTSITNNGQYVFDVVLADATSGAITITLPTAASMSGKIFFIKRISSAANAVTIGRTSSQTVDGVNADVTLATNYQSLWIMSDGSNWLKLSTV